MKLYKKIGPERIENRVRSLAAYLQESLMAMGDKITMLTPTETKSRGAQVAFRINNGNPKASSEFVTGLYSKKITLRYVGENNVDCVRVSTHYYNSREEIDTLVSEVKKALG